MRLSLGPNRSGAPPSRVCHNSRRAFRRRQGPMARLDVPEPPAGDPPDPIAATPEPADSTVAAPPSGAARGHLVAWLTVAALSWVLILARAPRAPGGFKVRALHLAYDAGHFVALGLASYWAVRLADRWVPRR